MRAGHSMLGVGLMTGGGAQHDAGRAQHDVAGHDRGRAGRYRMLVVSTLVTWMPRLGATCASSRLVPPYKSSPATTPLPAPTSLRTAASAAMPLAKAKA